MNRKRTQGSLKSFYGFHLHFSINCYFYYYFWEHNRHLTTWLDFSSSRETVSWLGSESPTTSFGLGTFPLSSGNLGSSQTKEKKRKEKLQYKNIGVNVSPLNMH
jgi:hypothetical protein